MSESTCHADTTWIEITMDVIIPQVMMDDEGFASEGPTCLAGHHTPGWVTNT